MKKQTPTINGIPNRIRTDYWFVYCGCGCGQRVLGPTRIKTKKDFEQMLKELKIPRPKESQGPESRLWKKINGLWTHKECFDKIRSENNGT